jgi:hypothetical protein
VARLWFDDAVSINVNLTLKVTGVAGADVAPAIETVLRKYDLDGDVPLTVADGHLAGETPYPLIISRFYAWHEEFEAALRAAVVAVAPDALVELTWGFPDEP